MGVAPLWGLVSAGTPCAVAASVCADLAAARLSAACADLLDPPVNCGPPGRLIAPSPLSRPRRRSGPGGLQLGRSLSQAGRDYLILERNASAGSYFARYPRHRTLISLNKRFTGRSDPEFNLRHDW